MDTIGEACRKEVTSLDLSGCMSRAVLKLLPKLTGLHDLTLSFYLFQFDDSAFKFCRNMESLEVLKLAPYWKCDELCRQAAEVLVTMALGHALRLREIVAHLTEFEVACEEMFTCRRRRAIPDSALSTFVSSCRHQIRTWQPLTR